jgi:Tfp pilus assembly protein PilN
MLAQRSVPWSDPAEGAERPRELAAQLKEFIAEGGIVSPEIYLALPSETAIVRDLRFPLAVKENFRETIRLEMEEYIPLAVEQIYYACQIVGEDKKNNQLSILLVVVRKEDLDPWLPMCRDLAAGVSGIEVAATALANGLAGSGSAAADQATVYFHPGGDLTTLCLLAGERLLAARTITDTTAPLSELLAPELKIARYHGLPPGQALGVLIGSETVRLGLEAGGSGDMGPVQALSPGDQESVAFLAAYGLARKGLGRVPGRINLMPPGQRKRLSRQGMYLVIALVLVNLLLFLGWTGSLLINKKMATARLDAEISKLAPRTADLVVIEKQVREARLKIERLSEFQSGRPTTADLLLELSRILPANAWVENLKIKNDTVEITGYGESVADLVTLIEASNVFKNAAFLSTIVRGKDGKENYKLQMAIE